MSLLVLVHTVAVGVVELVDTNLVGL